MDELAAVVMIFVIGMMAGAGIYDPYLKKNEWLRTDKEHERALVSYYEAESERFKKLAMEAGK